MKKNIETITSFEHITQRFLETLQKKEELPLYKMAVKDARQLLEDLAKSNPLTERVDKQSVDIEDRILPVGPNGKVSVRILRPKGNKATLPALIYFHGGGWVLGSKDTHDCLIRELANGAQCAVIFVNFTRSPEAKYPIANEESYAVTQYIAENAKEFNTVVTLLAKQRKGPEIIQQVLFYPVTDANFETPSYQRFAEGCYLTREAMRWFWDSYLPDEAMRKKPTASPLQASKEELKDMPPTLITTNEHDVLRYEGEAYAYKLMAANVPVTAIRFMGTIHDNLILGPISQTPAPRSAISLAISELSKAFKKERGERLKAA
jgi:acetyl esterase